MSDTLPFSEVKAHLSELADRVDMGPQIRSTGYLPTRDIRLLMAASKALLLPSLEESLDILRDDDLMKSLRKSRREASEGKRLRLRDHV